MTRAFRSILFTTGFSVFFLFLILGALFSSTASAQTSGLVAAYNFDEGSGTTLMDRSGNGNNGTLVSSPAWTAGKNGGALAFDGVDDYVSVPETSSLDISGSMTLAAWIKKNLE